MTAVPHSDPGGQDREDMSNAMLKIIRELVAELHPRAPDAPPPTLDSSLDEELAIDSLGRVELFARLQQAFHLTLTETDFADAETPRDLLRALRHASGTAIPAAPDYAGTLMPAEMDALPRHARTLVEVLNWHVAAHGERTHIEFDEEGAAGETISYRQLKTGAEAVANGLQLHGLRPQETVVLMLPTGKAYFFSFYGVLMAGGIPVPIYPPVRASRLEDHLQRQKHILENCQAAFLITIPESRGVARLLKSQIETLRHVVTAEELLASRGSPQAVVTGPWDIAFLQYTSGSTGNPKGVILTHANLLANIRADGTAIGANSGDVFVSWLPLYHDMGLIGAWLGSLYHAVKLVIMSPLAFLTRPQRWLWAIHRHHASLSAAPNFAYELCLKKITDQDLAGLDLGSWRIAFNGAEAVGARTVRQFSARFQPCGFRPEAMYPVYGLAECTLGLCFPPLSRAPRIDVIERDPFLRGGEARPPAGSAASVLQFVACGPPLPGHHVRVVGPTGRELPERQEGRLEFHGPSATSGYYCNPQATRRLYNGEWLDSGDLAYIAAGEVYITGRVKDVIIRAGRHIYPDELETAIGDLPGVRKGCVAVFGSTRQAMGTERLVVVAETHAATAAASEELRRRINRLTLDLTGVPANEIVLAPPHTVLKTSSGKLRRAATRARHEQGLLLQRDHAPWRQVAHFVLAGLRPALRRAGQDLAAELYAGYAWSMFALIGAGAWLAVLLLPRLDWRRRWVRGFARTLLRLTGIPLWVQGAEQLPPAQECCVLVANHASYLDSIVLSAALARPFGFVTKAELAGRFGLRVFLNRLGVRYVQRDDRRQGIAAARRLAGAVRAGESLVFFPEGTFTSVPGLRPFRLGAFVAAREAGVPVVPIAIRGTRAILWGDSWFPRRGAVTITIGSPLLMDDYAGQPVSAWQAAVAFRNRARAHIVSHCGEPDLAGTAPSPSHAPSPP